MRSCIDALAKKVIGAEGEEKKIFKKAPHMTFDNYFSGEEVFRYAGEKGFGLTMTTRRDRLPRGVEGQYLHKEKTESNQRTKVARFIEPVILVNDSNGDDDYEIVLTSFQSTSSCNIMSVNAIGENKNFIEARSRGRGENKRTYVIEQNMARLLYLKSYSRIDSIDHLIKNCNINYRSWKYWHSPINHAKALAIVTAYDIYLECTEGNLDPHWKVEDPVDFHTFRDILSIQMLQYDPVKQQYPGDEKMRKVSKLHKDRRSQKRKFPPQQKQSKQKTIEIAKTDGSGKISYTQYRDIVRYFGRICSNMDEYETHLSNITASKNPAKCAVCSEPSYKRCNVCKVPLHNNDIKGAAKGRNCFLHFHSESYLGLCFFDRGFLGQTAQQWRMWSNTKLQKNKRQMQGYRERLDTDDDSD